MQQLYKITFCVPEPGTFLALGTTWDDVIAKILDREYLTVELATALEITTHIRAGLPILGEPEPPFDRQLALLDEPAAPRSPQSPLATDP